MTTTEPTFDEIENEIAARLHEIEGECGSLRVEKAAERVVAGMKHDRRQRFNEAVISELEDRDRDDVAEMSRACDRDMGALSSADVAREIGVRVSAGTLDSVEKVADERTTWFEIEQEEMSAAN